MAKNMALWSMNFMRRLPGTRGVSYAAAVAEAGEGLSSEGSNDVVEYKIGYGERGVDHQLDLEAKKKKKNTRNIEECEWVPHPRSGIYFPKGHDWVLQDVPHSAASTSGPTFWLRNIDGVDGPHLHNF